MTDRYSITGAYPGVSCRCLVIYPEPEANISTSIRNKPGKFLTRFLKRKIIR
jgi:hypothetical protein